MNDQQAKGWGKCRIPGVELRDEELGYLQVWEEHISTLLVSYSLSVKRITSLTHDMSDSEELNVCKKTWARSMDGIQKDGFREGFEAGRDENLQNGFDIGFKTGYESCFQQVLEATRKQILESSDVPYQFPEDDCVICSHKSFDDFMDLPFNTIVEKQKHLMKDSRLSLREK